MRLTKRLRQSERGAAALEFALVIPVLVLFICGIARLGIMFMANAGLRNAVAEGARFATIDPRPSDQQIRDRITGSRFGLPGGLGTPTVTGGTLSDGTSYVDISASYTVPMDFVFFRAGNVTLTANRRAYTRAAPAPPPTPSP